jgi:hypothetical protein
LLLREEVASSVDFIFRTTFSLCKIRVNPFQFHMYTDRQISVYLFWSIDNISIDLTLVHVETRRRRLVFSSLSSRSSLSSCFLSLLRFVSPTLCIPHAFTLFSHFRRL